MMMSKWMHRGLTVSLGFGLGYVTAGTINFVTYFPEPVKIVWNTARNNGDVVDKLGEPISRGWVWDGSVTEWQASVTIPVSGPKAEGSLYGRLLKNDQGVWQPILVVLRSKNVLISVIDSTAPQSDV